MRHTSTTTLFVIAALASTALAGCVAGALDEGRGEPAPVAPRAPAEAEVELSGCTIPEAFGRAPADVARPHVPEDFDLALDGTGQAVVILGGLVCGDEGALAERGILAIMVTPRDEALLGEGETNYFWEPEHHLVEGSALTTAFLELGAKPLVVEDVAAGVEPLGVELVVDAGAWRHRASAATGAIPGGETAFLFGHFREYSAAEGGYVYLDASFDGAPGATFGISLAEVETGGGTVARELLGERSRLPLLSGTGLTYANAKVGFVPREA